MAEHHDQLCGGHGGTKLQACQPFGRDGVAGEQVAGTPVNPRRSRADQIVRGSQEFSRVEAHSTMPGGNSARLRLGRPVSSRDSWLISSAADIATLLSDVRSEARTTVIIINTAMTLAMAAGCLAAIATTLAVHAEAARRTVVVKHPRIVSPDGVSECRDARQNVSDGKR